MKLSILLLVFLLSCAAKPEITPSPAQFTVARSVVWPVVKSVADPIFYPQPYLIKPGDWLSKIALEEYGDTTKWHRIYAWNRQVIGDNPDLLYPYLVLQLRKSEVYTKQQRFISYRVVPFSPLFSISFFVYGDPHAWLLLFYDNRGVIRGLGNIPVGLSLRVRTQ